MQQRTPAEHALLETVLRARAALVEHSELSPDDLRERLHAEMHEEVELFQRRAAAANEPLLRDPADTEQWLDDQVLGFGVLGSLGASGECCAAVSSRSSASAAEVEWMVVTACVGERVPKQAMPPSRATRSRRACTAAAVTNAISTTRRAVQVQALARYRARRGRAILGVARAQPNPTARALAGVVA
jgi:hypothetical protein